MTWFDAHLDLAYLAVRGRDLAASLDELERPDAARRAGPHTPGALSLPALREGGVHFALGTIYTEPVTGGIPLADARGSLMAEQYGAGDVERAARVGRAQMEAYLTWRDAGLVALDLCQILHHDPHVGEVRGGMGVSEPVPRSIDKRIIPARRNGRVHLGILIEGADPIRSPDELPWWRERGVVAMGLTWAKSSRYATGNADPRADDRGLTDLGREMARAMDAARIAHDVSHLSQPATDELLALTDRAVIASHSNCRALLGGDGHPSKHRHLSDATIAEIARRGGMIGLNLFAPFIRNNLPPGHRPTIDDAVAHIEHVCAIAGHRHAVGLGSDMDGGFDALRMCTGIERPQHLHRLAEALAHRGWSETEIAGFTHLNWLRCFERALNFTAETQRSQRQDSVDTEPSREP